MPIGAIETEQHLADFVRAEIERSEAATQLKTLISRAAEVETGVLWLAAGVFGEQIQIAFGSTTVTITNGISARSADVAHGLDGVPLAVLATAEATADTREDYIATVDSFDGTNLKVAVRGGESVAFPLGNPTVVTVYWVAIG